MAKTGIIIIIIEFFLYFIIKKIFLSRIYRYSKNRECKVLDKNYRFAEFLEN